MTNSWNWKLILEATVYAKGSRSGMYSLFGDALERAKELPPEIILVPRLRRQFEDEVVKTQVKSSRQNDTNITNSDLLQQECTV